jgi:AcrR family transcriptional regulator
LPPKAGLSPAAVVTAALEVIDDAGADALTLARVAARTGVATPSLYKHVDGLPALRRLVRLRVQAEVTEQLRSAAIGRSRDDALRAIAAGIRDYLRQYPRRFPFLEAAPDPDDAELLAASNALVRVTFAVLDGYGLTGPTLVHATRCLRAAVHGFTWLEATGGFGLPEDVDRSFEYLIDMLIHGINELSRQPVSG